MPDAALETPDLPTALERLTAQAVPVRTTSPDLLGQLRQAREKPVKRIVCIGVDLDPQCDLLAEVRRTRSAEIESGLKLLQSWLDVKVIRIDTASAETAYPNLLPAMLVRKFSRKRLPHDALPTEAGILIVDVLTAAFLAPPPPGEAGNGIPVIIDDHLTNRRVRTTAHPETLTAAVFAAAGVITAGAILRHGVPAAECALDLSTPIGQTDLWLHLRPPAPLVSAACTRCGECLNVCPVRIHPAALLEAAQFGRSKMAQKFNAAACIECGLCTAVCPSSLPVKAGVVAAKRLLPDHATDSPARPLA